MGLIKKLVGGEGITLSDKQLAPARGSTITNGDKSSVFTLYVKYKSQIRITYGTTLNSSATGSLSIMINDVEVKNIPVSPQGSTVVPYALDMDIPKNSTVKFIFNVSTGYSLTYSSFYIKGTPPVYYKIT